jgi:2-keto-4-pentenoate hydratase/2-oxohepta-3-ene-1,7-dioic acid hydratase in catechol pathway
MAVWVRFADGDEEGFGALSGETIAVHTGDMFDAPKPTGAEKSLGAVHLLMPCSPSKMICLWNNFHAVAAKLGVAEPAEPLYLLKAPSSFMGTGEAIRRPLSYNGKIVYEGELGIVIGKRCSNASKAEAASAIFGYTCINDVTAADIISKDPTFAQCARAKSFDTFGIFGPAIATGLDPAHLTVRTVLNGAERQNYPISDMIFPAADQCLVTRHDAFARRSGGLRNFGRCRRDEGRVEYRGGDDRGHRHAHQYVGAIADGGVTELQALAPFLHDISGHLGYPIAEPGWP